MPALGEAKSRWIRLRQMPERHSPRITTAGGRACVSPTSSSRECARVAWYRPEQQELRLTTLKQGWRNQNGWQLVAEQCVEGDVGLLGEPVVYQAPEEVRSPAQFPTVRLGGD
jgi:hypothetical protein